MGAFVYLPWPGSCSYSHVHKVLVVDDDAMIVELIALILEDEGIDVLTAGDGLEALRIAREEHPKLVLTDVMMSRMNGLELCRRLRGDPSTSATVVLLMTAVARINLSGCGAAGLILKPFDLGDLSDTVHRHLRAA